MNFVNRDKRKFVNFVRTVLFCTILLSFFACKTAETTEEDSILDFSDDTTKAANLVLDANEDLNEIKIMYKKNEAKFEELRAAMGGQDASKVKEIAENFVYLINDGARLGQSALEKIDQAEAMNISPDFKDYLGLKSQSLRKQLEAFEHRRQAAILLRDSFGTNDKVAIKKAQDAFKSQEEIAHKIIVEAQELSKKANTLAKESSKKPAN